MAGLKIVGAVEHHVGLLHQLVQQCVVGSLRHAGDLHIRIDLTNGLGDRQRFELANTRRGVSDLPLQVCGFNAVMVNHRDAANACAAQIQRCRRAQPARADDQRMRCQQPNLTVNANVIEQDMPGVAQQLGVVHSD